MAADWISQSPGETILKRKLDPSQDAARPNEAHISRQLRASAAKVRKNAKIPHLMIYSNKCGERTASIDFMPYNRYLWLFLKGMNTNPPGNTTGPGATVLMQKWSDIEKTSNSFMSMKDLSKVLSDEAESKEDAPKTYEYPMYIADDLDKVLEGLMYIYASPYWTLGKVSRIQWRDRDGVEQTPVFANMWCAHDYTMPKGSRRCAVTSYSPYDERDYVWLEAFMNVVN